MDLDDYYKNQIKRKISNPPRDIAVINPAFIFRQPVVLIMEHHSITSPKYIIKGTNGQIFFSGYDSLTKCVVYDAGNKPLINIRTNLTGDFKVYLGKDKQNKPIVETCSKRSWAADKKTVHYYNLTRNCGEVLDLNMESSYRSAGLFAGKEKHDAPMICKIMRLKSNQSFSHSEYSIEMAPNVDNLFLVAIGIMFMSSYESYKRRMRNQNTTVIYK